VANKLLIVHGYSDGSTSFTALGGFLIERNLYAPHNVFYLDYSSMDDDASFEDFADKLDTDHRARLGGERVDVVCHSTGSLVVRSWLALHAERSYRRQQPEPCPVDRLICFAPANFGSDLAKLGQSFLSKFRSTFFNSHSHDVDFMESGKRVLQGLEPASPFQWRLSEIDLHSERSYFRPDADPQHRCYPVVLAAGTGYSGLQAKIIKARAMPGTDGTVRIAGTSLNTRSCTLDFREAGPKRIWWRSPKYEDIPFAVFSGVNHGSIIEPRTPASWTTGAREHGRSGLSSRSRAWRATRSWPISSGPSTSRTSLASKPRTRGATSSSSSECVTTSASMCTTFTSTSTSSTGTGGRTRN
jgi:pimeloyl-ACP methyl ester carboxylesterase